MARRSLLFTGLLAFSLAAVACGGGGGGGTSGSPSASGSTSMRPQDITGTIRLLSYSDGYDPAYMASFYKEYPNIKLETASMDSNEAGVAKIEAGFQVDVINACVDEAALEMVQKGLYMPLDTSRLTYWNDLFPSTKTLPGVVGPDGKYYVEPVDLGAGGIMYNADVVTTPPTSWADLFDPKWSGRVALENNATTAFMIGALATGVPDPLHMTDAQVEQVTQFLIAHKSQFRTFYNAGGSIRPLFKAGEVVMASGYSDEAAMMRQQGVNVQLAIPKEGAILWACGYGISPDIDPANLDAAYALLNWYDSPQAELYEVKAWSYQVANQDILKIAPPSLIKSDALNMPNNMQNAIPAHPPENRAALVAAWTEVKAA